MRSFWIYSSLFYLFVVYSCHCITHTQQGAVISIRQHSSQKRSVYCVSVHLDATSLRESVLSGAVIFPWAAPPVDVSDSDVSDLMCSMSHSLMLKHAVNWNQRFQWLNQRFHRAAKTPFTGLLSSHKRKITELT